MWNDSETLTRLSKGANWSAVAFALVSAIAGLVAMAGGLPLVSGWVAVAFALLSASAGVAPAFIARRLEVLAEAFRRTPPAVDASVKTGEGDGAFYVVIEPRNQVPFKCYWALVTKANRVTSGTRIEGVKIVPSASRPQRWYREQVTYDTIVDDYIELQFRYQSVFAPEVPGLKLSGEFVRRYTVSADRKACFPYEDGPKGRKAQQQ